MIPLTFVRGIDENHFVELVRRILSDPVRVEHAQGGAAAANTFFGDGLERTLEFQLVDTLMFRFTIDLTFWHWLLA